MISVEELVSYSQELEDMTPGSGMDWLKARRDEAIAKIDGGGSRDYIQAAGNGKTFTRQFHATALDWFSALQQAIAYLNMTRVKVTYPTFCPPH